MTTSGRLQGKVAIITGAAGNIGMATVEAFLDSGCRVVAVDHRMQPLETVARRHGSALALVNADVTSEDDTAKMAAAAQQHFGRLDIVFANAGVEGVVRRVAEYPMDAYERVMDVNVKGVFLALKVLAPAMADGGSFILTSSIMGLKGAPINSAYTASKHAVVGLMRAAAIDFAERRIRVNCVHPGLVESDMLSRLLEGFPDPPARRAAAVASVKLGRLIQPVDIARAVLFLASDESVMVTGQTLAIDGGQLL